MKKKGIILTIICIAFIATQSKAQFNYIGGGIVLTTANNGYVLNDYEFYNNTFGFDIRMNYNYSKKIQIAPDVKIYLPNKESFPNGGSTKTTVFAFNLNGHFILNSRSRNSYRLYLLAGAHISGWNIVDKRGSTTYGNYNSKDFKFVPGGNVGAGMQFKLSNRLLFYAEAKYVISQANQLIFNPGILYNF